MTAILKNVFENSIGISVIILILFFLRGIIGKRYTARWQYWVWIILTLRLILPFDISMGKFEPPLEINMSDPVVYEKPVQSDSEDTVTTAPDYSDNKPIDFTEDNIVIMEEDNIYDRNIFEYTAGLMKRSSIVLSDFLCFIWICGAVMLLCIRLGSYFIARTSLMKTLKPYETDMGYIQQRLNIGGEVEVFTSYMVTTPVLTGVFNPRIIIPEDSINDVHLQLALYHELVHYKRCDIGVKLLLFAVTCTYWYNPCIWLMNRLAMEDIELSCDETIYRKMGTDGKSLYGESILMFAAKKKENLLYSTSFSNNKQTTANRIKNIFNSSKKRTSAVALAFIVVFAMLSGSLVACTTAEAEIPVPDSNTVLEIGPEDDTALYIINLYEKYSQGRDYDCNTVLDDFMNQYYHIKPALWGLFNEMGFSQYRNYYNDYGDYQYEIPADLFLPVANALYETKYEMNEGNFDIFEGNVIIYDPKLTNLTSAYGKDYKITLVPLGKRILESNDICYSFERRNNGEITGYVDYVVTPYIMEDVPYILNYKFNDGDTIYAIKEVASSKDIFRGEEKIVEISTPDDLIKMSIDYAANGHKYFNYTYILTNDIDMNGIDSFLPIGRNKKLSYDDRDTSADGFCSVFDGKGYTIKNLTVIDSQEFNCGEYYAGFFAEISKYGTVKNLNLENLNIVSNNTAGGFAGTVCGVVENCTVQGTVKTQASAGGFAANINGYSSTVIKNCVADVDVYGESVLGGFVGCSSYWGYENRSVEYTIENCISYGSVNSDKFTGVNYSHYDNPNTIGGFAGRAITGNYVNCHVQTPIHLNHTANMVGSFVAVSENVATYTNCTYNPETAGNWHLIGTFEGKNSNGDYRGFEFTETVK